MAFYQNLVAQSVCGFLGRLVLPRNVMHTHSAPMASRQLLTATITFSYQIPFALVIQHIIMARFSRAIYFCLCRHFYRIFHICNKLVQRNRFLFFHAQPTHSNRFIGGLFFTNDCDNRGFCQRQFTDFIVNLFIT